MTAASLAPMAAMLPSLAAAADADAKMQLMFVQSADSLKAGDQVLRLVGGSQQTVWFSDRPERKAVHLSRREYIKAWTAAAWPSNLSKDPPNSTHSVYQPGKDDNTLTVVEISEPKVEGKDLVYAYKLIEGQMPKTGTAPSLFIDWIGVGGGVGPGFHGVGVGRRGVGWR